MQPHIVPILIGELVAEPFVAEFVVEQPVIALGGLLVAIAVSVDRLVLHAEMRRLHHAHLFIAERVGADGAFEEIERRREFAEQLLRLRLFAGQEPIGHRNDVAEAASILGADALIGRNVERDGVVVRMLRAPVPGDGAVGIVLLADEEAV